jgi:hypothetical protein
MSAPEPRDRGSHELWLLAQEPAVIQAWLERRLRGQAGPSMHPQEIGDGYLSQLLRRHPRVVEPFRAVGDGLLGRPGDAPDALCSWALAVMDAGLDEARRIEAALFVGDGLSKPFREMTERTPALRPHPLDMLLRAWALGRQRRDGLAERRLRGLMRPVGDHDPTLACFSALMDMQPRSMEREEVGALMASWVRVQDAAIPMAVAAMVRERVSGANGKDVKAALDVLQPPDAVRSRLIEQVALRLDGPACTWWREAFQPVRERQQQHVTGFSLSAPRRAAPSRTLQHA